MEIASVECALNAPRVKHGPIGRIILVTWDYWRDPDIVSIMTKRGKY